MHKPEGAPERKNPDRLNILWTTGDPLTARYMVLQYAIGCITQDWWDSVEVILQGASIQLAARDEAVRETIRVAMHTGVEFSACSAAARQLGVSSVLQDLGIELRGQGLRLSNLIRQQENLLVV